jgi:hypothetical protein
MADLQDQQNELLNTFREQQQKYVYYLIALSVTAIGFSIVSTSGKPLRLSQIPVGLAVLSWGLSVYCGLTFVKYTISNLYSNSAYFDVLLGKHPLTGAHPDKIKVGSETIWEIMQENSEKGGHYSMWQCLCLRWRMRVKSLWDCY